MRHPSLTGRPDAPPDPKAPPLAPTPRLMWLRRRVLELTRAIHDYAAHDLGTSERYAKLIDEWAEELAEVTAELWRIAKRTEEGGGGPA